MMPIIARSSPCPIRVVVAGSMRACANVAKGGDAVKPAVGLYLTRSSLQEDVAIAVVVLGIDHVQRAGLPGLEEHLDTAIQVDSWGSVLPRGPAARRRRSRLRVPPVVLPLTDPRGAARMRASGVTMIQ